MHGGGIPGFQSVYFRDQATGATVVVASNCTRCVGSDGSEFDVLRFGTRLMEYALGGSAANAG